MMFPSPGIIGVAIIAVAWSASLPTISAQSPAADLKARWYRATLESPGGELVFGLKLETTQNKTTASIVNGSEVIKIPTVAVNAASRHVELGFDYYDSKIDAHWSDDSGKRMTGKWRKRTAGKSAWVEMAFQADEIHSQAEIFPMANGAIADVSGRWLVQFASDQDPAVGIFEQAGHSVTGTFLTTTGDFRFLAGAMRDQQMELSCFDGAHAFLFRARLEDAQLTGDFWSSASFHDSWTAIKNENAKLPNPFGMTKWNENVRLADLKFADFDGTVHSLAEEKFAGKVIILQLFGSWCPNCHDAAEFLAELHQEYKRQGLSIVGLAFEYTDDAERNAEQVRRYIARHDVKYPVLMAGPSDKGRATEAFRGLDRVKAFPTTIFMNSKGEVHSIYTGFSGPATDQKYVELKQAYRRVIEEILKADDQK